jgi:1-acyl-sn-glycerol-3-phosphate acyltransferase
MPAEPAPIHPNPDDPSPDDPSQMTESPRDDPRPRVIPSPPPARVDARAGRRRRAAAVDTDFARRGPARVARSIYTATALRALRAVFAPTTTTGAERLAAGPYVFAANHSSHADTMVIVTTLPGRFRRRVVVAAAADYFFPNRVTAMLTAVFVGAIPVERDRVSRRTLDLCHRLLGEGWSLVLYPEGGRSPDGEIQEFRPGAAWMARRAAVPVVPVRIDGTHDVLPKGRALPRRAPVRVTYGEPVVLTEGEDARSFGRRIEEAVRDLGSLSSPGGR